MFTLHGSTTITYSRKTNHLLWACSQKKATCPSHSQWGTYSDRLSHTAAESNNRLVEGKLNRRWQETNCRVEKGSYFLQTKAWESGPLKLCFSVSGKQSPSHKGGQVYGALDGIRKTVRCMWSKSELHLYCGRFHVSGGSCQAMLVEVTPADGPLKVGEKRKEGKRSTNGQKRRTDRDNKEKGVLWCLVYIPQPSFLKYSKISNLNNQMSANNPLSRKQRASRIPAQVLPSVPNGDRWSEMAV